MELSLFKVILILVIVFVIFGAGKLPQVMGDMGKGLRALKDGMKADEDKKPTITAEKVEDKGQDPHA